MLLRVAHERLLRSNYQRHSCLSCTCCRSGCQHRGARLVLGPLLPAGTVCRSSTGTCPGMQTDWRNDQARRARQGKARRRRTGGGARENMASRRVSDMKRLPPRLCRAPRRIAQCCAAGCMVCAHMLCCRMHDVRAPGWRGRVQGKLVLCTGSAHSRWHKSRLACEPPAHALWHGCIHADSRGA